MEGTLQEFTDKLAAKGFTPVKIQDDISLLEGEFAGYKDCSIWANTDKSGTIFMVCVFLPEMETWRELELCYMNFKSMLSEKYGEPEDCVEEFQYSYADDDRTKLHELKMDRCKYYSVFSCDNGYIRLDIDHQGSYCWVTLSYFDNENQDKRREQNMDDL